MQKITIKLSTLSKPRDICHVMEKHGVKYYTYTFESTRNIIVNGKTKKSKEVIKHGKAADKEWESGTWGDRIYRQASGIDGWREYELNNSAATKMRSLMSNHFPDLDRHSISIVIYDYTAELENQTEEERDRVLLNEEDALVKAHVAKTGEQPKLNIQKTKTRLKPIFPKGMWE